MKTDHLQQTELNTLATKAGVHAENSLSTTPIIHDRHIDIGQATNDNLVARRRHRNGRPDPRICAVAVHVWMLCHMVHGVGTQPATRRIALGLGGRCIKVGAGHRHGGVAAKGVATDGKAILRIDAVTQA